MTHADFSSCLKSWKAERYGQRKATPKIHVAGIRKGQVLEPMNGRRSGNTTSPNQSAAIRTKLSIDTIHNLFCAGFDHEDTIFGIDQH